MKKLLVLTLVLILACTCTLTSCGILDEMLNGLTYETDIDYNANVTKWSMQILTSMYDGDCEAIDNGATLRSTSKFMAIPGTSKTVSLTTDIVGTSEVALQLDTDVEILATGFPEGYFPVQFNIGGDIYSYETADYENVDAFLTVVEKVIEKSVEKKIAPGEECLEGDTDISVNFEVGYSFENGNDALDTQIGNSGVTPTVEFVFTQSLKQIATLY